MSRPPTTNRVPTKDMYWFAHGGIESNSDKCLNQRSTTPGECEEDGSDSSSPTLRSLPDRKGLTDDQKSTLYMNSVVDSGNFSGPSSLEIKDDRTRNLDKRIAVEERRKQLWEAEQERNDAVLRKHMEREAALEARRNAQRSNISFAFGSSVPRNVESLQSGDSDKINRHSNASGLLQKGDDMMSKSMTASVPAPRGRRKNDLMPTVPYDRTPAPKSASTCSARKRSVSMTRLDQLAQPRRHYVEANKASSTTSSGASSMLKDTLKSPTRPLSSASEQSGGSGRVGSSATRRVRSSPRKPRPVSIAGTVPDNKPHEVRVSPIKKTFVANKKPQTEAKKAAPVTSKQSTVKPSEKSKPIEKAKPAPRPTLTSKPSKQISAKQTPSPKTSSPKAPTAKKAVTNKKKADIMVSSQQPSDVILNQPQDDAKTPTSPKSSSPPPDNTVAEAECNNAKRIISEEEAKAALAEKRRLAREQAEKEAELERQRQEELRRKEEERLRVEEEEQKQMEEEQLRLLEEHRKQEEEKLRKAIEENERKEEKERARREEEQRLKAEQERKALEEVEKQRIEFEENFRKEEEERAERKKRLEKIMSRTRGKSSNTSPSGSVSGSEQLDSSENQQENLSSGANSLDSNVTGEISSGPASLECQQGKSEPLTDGTSMEANPTYDVASDNESLIDIVMPKSETASQDNSLVIISDQKDFNSVDSVAEFQAIDCVVSKAEDLELQTESIGFSADLVVNDETKPASIEESQGLVEIEDVHDENVKEVLGVLSDINQIIDVPVESEMTVEDSSDLKIDKEKKEIVEVIEPVSEIALLKMTSIVSVQHDSESSVINQAEVVLSSGEDIKNLDDASISSFADITNTLLPDVPQSSESYASEQAGPEEAEMEQHSHFSTSSDIKLPDPIYETSDEGSVSSEKHQQDCSTFGLQDEESHQESQTISDEVFSEKEIQYSEETDFNPFEKHIVENPASNLMAAYDNQFEIEGMQSSIYAYETSEAMPGVIEQPREIGEENVYPTRSSTSSIPETSEDLKNVKGNVSLYSDAEENKENIDNEMTLLQMNPFAAAENCASEYDIYADKENMQFTSPEHIIPGDMSVYKSDMLPEQFNLEINEIHSGDNSNNAFLMQESTVLEQNFENQSVLKSFSVPSEAVEFSDVTIIKAEGSGECIGIISSIDHDHVSNELVQQSMQNEQLKCNFEYSSITDSEESSLDSNLSQVMTVEVSEKNSVGLNVENVSLESPAVLSNVQEENIFKEPAINGSNDLKANGDHYSDKEILSNGHRIESSDPKLEQIGDYVQVDGKHISSVDHSKTNIFDNVDAVDFGKMSPDPFLAKGSSNQISGNPFLLQDDQKQVLMTPDFYN